MMRNIYFFFQKKIHFPNAKSRWGIIMFITLWVLLILYSLQPFGINFAKNKLVIIALNTTGIFLVCVICIQGLFLVFRKYYSPDTWTNGKFFGLCFIVITVFSVLDTFALSIYIDSLEGLPYYAHIPSLQRFFMFYKASVFISVFPVSIVYYILDRIKREEQKTQIQAEVHIMPADGETEEDHVPIIELYGKTKDYISLLPESILYIKAMGNYVAVYYLNDEKEGYKLLRMSMSELSGSLCDFPYIIRCHRAFMINIQKIEKIHGNLKGYLVELKNTEVKVPVSKSYTRIVKEKIMQAGISAALLTDIG